MVKRDKLIEYINTTLNFEPDKDPYLFNSIQVIGKENIAKITLGVSPNLEMFQKAAMWGADMIILHHGLLGPKLNAPITRVLKQRLKILFDYDITLLTYHYYLDSHRELGNNAQIIKRLGAKIDREFGKLDNLVWGYEGVYPESITQADFIKRLKKLWGEAVKVFAYGPKQITRFAAVSGGGPYLLSEAVDKNLDVFITGEVKESTEALAKEAGIHFVYPGHYNSEKFGIIALGNYLEEQFPKLKFKFIEIPNPI